MEKILDKKDMEAFIGELKKRCDLIGPVRKGSQIRFAHVWRAGEMALEGYANSTMSPKEIFFPQSEVMLSFSKSGENANIYRDEMQAPDAKAVFGIRPCDAKAFALLDRIFTNDQFTDTYWVAKRDAATLIGLACNEPCSTCFCTSVGSHPFGEKGLDIMAIDLGDRYLLKILTEKGRDLAEGTTLLKDASEADISAGQALSVKAEESITSRVEVDRIKDKTVLELYNSDIWTKFHQACLNCGTCTYTCPTCHCFDIQDEAYRDGGVRLRNWDSCMTWLFTVHATGHNPRPSGKERVRQRFMHKFKYIPVKRDGETGCVGCGRCINLCPVNLDIREISRAMNN